jgi:hypothetical protein
LVAEQRKTSVADSPLCLNIGRKAGQHLVKDMEGAFAWHMTCRTADFQQGGYRSRSQLLTFIESEENIFTEARGV